MINRLTLLFTLALLCGCGKPAQPPASGNVPERIISFAPNITETIYALRLGDKLVGATTYCTYPGAAQTVPRIGSFGSINYEAIVTLQPDLVILHKEYDADKARLDGLGIPYLETGSYFIADILETIRCIGAACGVQDRADELVRQLTRRMAGLKNETTNRPRVLLTFGGSAGEVEQIHAFGPACIHNELLVMAGGRNVIEGALPFSVISKEAVMRLDPDIIIVLAPEMEPMDDPSSPWKKLTSVTAVKNNRIHVLTGDYTCIPGPRFIQTLEDFAEIIRQNNLEAE
jgi:iron complex transport system substrate-binding protein